MVAFIAGRYSADNFLFTSLFLDLARSPSSQVVRVFLYSTSIFLFQIMHVDIDYEQSLFPLRDSRGKPTRERARNRLLRWNMMSVSTR